MHILVRKRGGLRIQCNTEDQALYSLLRQRVCGGTRAFGFSLTGKKIVTKLTLGIELIPSNLLRNLPSSLLRSIRSS